MNYFEYMADNARPCAIVAHRGVWREAPENSLPAIERAIAAGYDVVEIDVRRTADGEFVLLHDDTLERMAGLNREPEEMTSRELASLKLRNRDGGENNEFTNEKLPGLKEVFELTRNRIFVHLDIKQRQLIPEVIACAQAMGVDKQVDVWADLRTAADLDWVSTKVLSHGIPFIARTHLEDADADTQIDLVFKLKPFVCEVSFNKLEQVAALKEHFHEAGIALWVNTLDTVASCGFTDTAALQNPELVWGKLMNAGVSSIQTDEMEALRAFIRRRDGNARSSAL